MGLVEKIMWVALGGAVGATGRFVIAQWAVERWGGAFPYGTLIVNVVGSFLLGLLFALSIERVSLNPRVFAFLGAGFCGAFTTVSTFSVETLQLSQNGMVGVGMTNVVLNTGLSLLAAFLGMLFVRSWNSI